MGVTNLLSLVFGVMFIYFLLSLVCNSVFEAMSAKFGWRSKFLTDWVQKTFPGIYPLLLTNPLLDGLSANGESTSYMSAANFTTALFGIIARSWQQIPANINEMEQALTDFKEHEATRFTSTRSIIPDDFNRALLMFINDARLATKDEGEQMKLLRTKIETWFDSMMDRITGNYKRKSMFWSVVIAAIVVIAGNVDSISVISYLSTTPTALNELTKTADATLKDPKTKQLMDSIATGKVSAASTKTATDLISSLQDIKKQNDQVGILVPVGWQNAKFYADCASPQVIFMWWLSKVFGLLITIFAASLGAPFWYNLLVKVSDIRSSIKPATAVATLATDDKQKKNTDSKK